MGTGAGGKGKPIQASTTALSGTHHQPWHMAWGGSPEEARETIPSHSRASTDLGAPLQGDLVTEENPEHKKVSRTVSKALLSDQMGH